MSGELLNMTKINKSFFGVKVLDEAELEVRSGEVHILLGENGAGKSSLIKVLSGAYHCDEGTILLEGQPLTDLTPRKALSEGISVIYQEFNLLPEQPIYENIFLGKEPAGRFFLDLKKTREQAEHYMKKVGLEVDPGTLVKDLTVAQKQLVEIAKAISNQVRILVLDEPTAALTDRETRKLFEVIRELKGEGIGIIYISHRMREFFEIGDRCTVMRDGRTVATLEISGTDEDELTRLMVGHQVQAQRKVNPHLNEEEILLKVDSLAYRNCSDISFVLHRGEVLGITGLIGSGKDEVVKCIMGILPKLDGHVEFLGREHARTPGGNIDRGLVYLSDDRKDEGLIQIHSVLDNFALPNLKRLATPLLNRKRVEQKTNEYIQKLNIKTHSTRTEVQKLSGGNQQKLVIAKWLYSGADVYIFNEPTRGIDVGAREEIYQIMEEILAGGASILMVTSDLQELLQMSDRILVMKDGRVRREWSNDGSVSEQMILAAAM